MSLSTGDHLIPVRMADGKVDVLKCSGSASISDKSIPAIMADGRHVLLKSAPVTEVGQQGIPAVAADQKTYLVQFEEPDPGWFWRYDACFGEGTFWPKLNYQKHHIISENFNPTSCLSAAEIDPCLASGAVSTEKIYNIEMAYSAFQDHWWAAHHLMTPYQRDVIEWDCPDIVGTSTEGGFFYYSPNRDCSTLEILPVGSFSWSASNALYLGTINPNIFQWADRYDIEWSHPSPGIRRNMLSLDIVGIPPSFDEIRADVRYGSGDDIPSDLSGITVSVNSFYWMREVATYPEVDEWDVHPVTGHPRHTTDNRTKGYCSIWFSEDSTEGDKIIRPGRWCRTTFDPVEGNQYETKTEAVLRADEGGFHYLGVKCLGTYEDVEYEGTELQLDIFYED